MKYLWQNTAVLALGLAISIPAWAHGGGHSGHSSGHGGYSSRRPAGGHRSPARQPSKPVGHPGRHRSNLTTPQESRPRIYLAQ